MVVGTVGEIVESGEPLARSLSIYTGGVQEEKEGR